LNSWKAILHVLEPIYVELDYIPLTFELKGKYQSHHEKIPSLKAVQIHNHCIIKSLLKQSDFSCYQQEHSAYHTDHYHQDHRDDKALHWRHA